MGSTPATWHLPPPVHQDRVWSLRSAFDTMLDELGDEEATATVHVGEQAVTENTRFDRRVSDATVYARRTLDLE